MDLKGMRLAFVFQSLHAPLKPCFQHVGSMSCAQWAARDGAKCYSKKEELATVEPMHFCLCCLGVCAGKQMIMEVLLKEIPMVVVIRTSSSNNISNSSGPLAQTRLIPKTKNDALQNNVATFVFLL